MGYPVDIPRSYIDIWMEVGLAIRCAETPRTMEIAETYLGIALLPFLYICRLLL